jgi:hypothetical protein
MPLLHDPPRIVAESRTEPIVAWRSWALRGGSGNDDLRLLPVAARAKPWRPREPVVATCKRTGVFHEAPSVSCSCGLYGSLTLDLLRKTRRPAVLGRVALWGRVIEHEQGFRGQVAYPQRLRLLCQFCFWQRGVLGAHPSVVGVYARGEMIPMCDEHLATARVHGMPPRSLQDALELEQRLRSTYVVDLLAI